MCGISGFIKLNENIHFTREQLHAMSNTIRHRGPDYQGYYYDEQVGLAHNRLSIIDLSATANQPFTYRNFVITFNGEIYNFKELKHILEQKGHQFKTQSDTEVIGAAFAQWGTDAFVKMNGIFAFAIYNTISRETIIVRDRFGVKPLYYWHNNNILLFASEIKAILASGIIEKKINYTALNEYMYYVNPIGTQTIYEHIHKLAPGNSIHIAGNNINMKQYWDIDYSSDCNDDENTATEKTAFLLEQSVKRQLVSDVQVSTFLSGGIDSSAITTFAAKHYHKPLHTYSVAFDFNRGGKSELEAAKRIAEKNNTIHHEVTITSQNLSETVNLLSYQHDEPFADAANIPLYLLTRTLKQEIKVVLQGDGGDELFGGYNYYNLAANAAKYILPSLLYKYTLGQLSIAHPLFQKIKRIAYSMSEKDIYTKIGLIVTGAELYNKPLSSLHPDLQKACLPKDPFAALRAIPKPNNDIVRLMQWIDVKTILPNDYLEKVDKSTMANSIEVRVPFLDNDLADYALSLSGNMKMKNGVQKYLLKKALRGTIPDAILDAPKRGFGVPCIEWLQTGLNTHLKEVLNDPAIIKANLFDHKILYQKIRRLDNGDKSVGMDLWRCYNLALWYNHYMIS